MKQYVLLSALLIGMTGLKAQNSVKMQSWQSESQAALMYSSPNGKYGIGYSNGWTILHIPAENKTFYYGEHDPETGFMYTAYTFTGVNDHGEIAASQAIDNDLTNMIPGIFKDGTFTELAVPEEVICASATDISEDGTVVGWFQKKGGGGYYYPCVWRNGRFVELKVPEKDFYNRTETGGVAYHISADGKVISGSYIPSFGDEWLPAVWTDDELECQLPCLDIMFNFDQPVTLPMPESDDYITVPWDDPKYTEQVEAFNQALQAYLDQVNAFRGDNLLDGRIAMSPNGKYLATYNRTRNYQNIPAIIDVATGELTQIDDYPDAIALSVTNDKNLLFATPNFAEARTEYIYFGKTGKTVELKDYLNDKYGFDMMDGEGGLNSVSDYHETGSAVCNADGSVFFGYLGGVTSPVYNYSIILPESLDATGIRTVSKKGASVCYADGMLNFDGNATRLAVYDLKGLLVYQADKPLSNVSLSLQTGIYGVNVVIDGGAVFTKISVK